MIHDKCHVWISDNPLAPERVIYRFYDPSIPRLYVVSLNFCSSSQCWDVNIAYDNGEPDGWSQWLNPYLRGFYSYDDLSIPMIR